MVSEYPGLPEKVFIFFDLLTIPIYLIKIGLTFCLSAGKSHSMGASEGGIFPQIESKVSSLQPDGSLHVVISLPDFVTALNADSMKALTMGTPVPERAQQIIQQAVKCCASCHFQGDESKPAGRGVAANCNGFSIPDGDLYDVMVDVDEGFAAAAEIIIKPLTPGKSSALVSLTTPCGITPSGIFDQHVGLPA